MVNIKLVPYEETPEFKKLGLTAFDKAQLQKLKAEEYTHYVLENISGSEGKHLYFLLMFYKTEASALLYYGLMNEDNDDCLIGSLHDEAIEQVSAETDLKVFYKARMKQRALTRFIDRLAH